MWTASIGQRPLKRQMVVEPTVSIAKVFTTPGPSTPRNVDENDGENGDSDFSQLRGSAADFSQIRAINRGAHSLVSVVLDRRPGGGYYALKAVSKQRLLAAGCAESVCREKAALQALAPHAFIARLHGTGQDERQLYMLLQLCVGGDLRGVLLRRARMEPDAPGLEEGAARYYIGAMAHALQHIHERGFVYRDLKPDNVVLDDGGFPLLCDFGSCVAVGDGGRAMTMVGTWEYAAPETLERRGATMASDLWSLGVVAYECLLGDLPFRPAADADADAGDSGGGGGGGDEGDAAPEAVLREIRRRAHVYAMAEALGADALSLVCLLLERGEQPRWEGTRRLRSHPFFSALDWDGLAARRLRPPFRPDLRGAADTSGFSHVDPESIREFEREVRRGGEGGESEGGGGGSGEATPRRAPSPLPDAACWAGF